VLEEDARTEQRQERRGRGGALEHLGREAVGPRGAVRVGVRWSRAPEPHEQREETREHHQEDCGRGQQLREQLLRCLGALEQRGARLVADRRGGPLVRLLDVGEPHVDRRCVAHTEPLAVDARRVAQLIGHILHDDLHVGHAIRESGERLAHLIELGETATRLVEAGDDAPVSRLGVAGEVREIAQPRPGALELDERRPRLFDLGLALRDALLPALEPVRVTPPVLPQIRELAL
jgi:hypothetical protein